MTKPTMSAPQRAMLEILAAGGWVECGFTVTLFRENGEALRQFGGVETTRKALARRGWVFRAGRHRSPVSTGPLVEVWRITETGREALK